MNNIKQRQLPTNNETNRHSSKARKEGRDVRVTKKSPLILKDDILHEMFLQKIPRKFITSRFSF